MESPRPVRSKHINTLMQHTNLHTLARREHTHAGGEGHTFLNYSLSILNPLSEDIGGPDIIGCN